MHPVAEQLLEQHIEFELDALTDKRLQAFIRAGVQRWFELAESEPLGAIATRQRCVGAFKRLFVDATVPSSAGEFGVSLLACFARRLEDAGVELRAILERDRFLELVRLVANLHEPRRRLVAWVFHHPLYSELISNLVYQALLNYVVQDNLISQRVPGVGSVLRLGRMVANRDVPGLDATVERRLKGYIKAYLPSLIKTSEQFVDRLVTDEDLLLQASVAWPEIGSFELAALVDGFGPDDTRRIGAWSKDYWDELRRTDWFLDIGETLIGHVFDRHGDEPLAVLLGDPRHALEAAPDAVLRIRCGGEDPGVDAHPLSHRKTGSRFSPRKGDFASVFNEIPD